MKLKLSEAFVEKLIARAKRTPYFHLPGYMERFWLLPYRRLRKRWWTRVFVPGFAARIHHILRSDGDRHFHDHPWNFLTIILKGGYWEIKPVFDKSNLLTGETRVWHPAGSIRFVRAKTWHRLELPPGQTAWTLFITFGYRQKWGFLIDPKYKMHYQEYLDLIGSETNPQDSEAAQG